MKAGRSSAVLPLGSRRMAEWALLALLIALVTVLMSRQAATVRGQAELASVKATLGGLRIAFVIDQVGLSRTRPNAPRNERQSNPFELLESRPLNYFGDTTTVDFTTVPPGSWVFDAVCDCVGYVPMDPQWLFAPGGQAVAWFQVTGTQGPLQLQAREAYLWQGQLID